jgi:hypothetical protein
MLPHMNVNPCMLFSLPVIIVNTNRLLLSLTPDTSVLYLRSADRGFLDEITAHLRHPILSCEHERTHTTLPALTEPLSRHIEEDCPHDHRMPRAPEGQPQVLGIPPGLLDIQERYDDRVDHVLAGRVDLEGGLAPFPEYPITPSVGARDGGPGFVIGLQLRVQEVRFDSC